MRQQYIWKKLSFAVGLALVLVTSVNAMELVSSDESVLPTPETEEQKNEKDERITRQFYEDFLQCNPTCKWIWKYDWNRHRNSTIKPKMEWKTVDDFIADLKNDSKKKKRNHLLNCIDFEVYSHLHKRKLMQIQMPSSLGDLQHVQELSFWIEDSINDQEREPSYWTMLLLFPSEIRQLVNLTTVEIKYFYFSDMSWVGELTGLKKLTLGHNKIDHFPDSIGNLKNLEYINIHANPLLKYFPCSIGKLLKLEEIKVISCKEFYFLLLSIVNLKNLRVVSIDYTPFSSSNFSKEFIGNYQGNISPIEHESLQDLMAHYGSRKEILFQKYLNVRELTDIFPLEMIWVIFDPLYQHGNFLAEIEAT